MMTRIVSHMLNSVMVVSSLIPDLNRIISKGKPLTKNMYTLIPNNMRVLTRNPICAVYVIQLITSH